MKKLLLAVCAVVLVPELALAATSGRCTAVALSSPQINSGALKTTFSATRAIDLNVSVIFSSTQASTFGAIHTATVQLTTPRGHVYQTITVPFSSDSAKKGTPYYVAGYPDTLRTLYLTSMSYNGATYKRLKVSVPVAGTPIVTSSLYGQWTATATIDTDALPCANPANFTVTQ